MTELEHLDEPVCRRFDDNAIQFAEVDVDNPAAVDLNDFVDMAHASLVDPDMIHAELDMGHAD